MLRYLNGLIGNYSIAEEKVLSITLSDGESGQALLPHIEIIADTYRKIVTCVCFIGGEQDQVELAQACKTIHKHGLKTALVSSMTEPSQINKTLTSELDYIKFKPNRLMKKDYCPFGDIEDWIDVEETK